MIYPATLRDGDRIALLSPAGAIDNQFIKGAVARLERWGLKPLVMPHAEGNYGRYSGTETDRLSDLKEAFENPSIRAILCCRGGYGTIQLLESLSRIVAVADPKWVIGYSDITALHALMQQAGVVSIHGPMARHLSETDDTNPATAALHQILIGHPPVYNITTHTFNRTGTAIGMIRGGNLALLQSLRGTNFDYIPENSILFIEDIGERPYQIERMIYNLKLGGVFDRIAGLIVGSFTNCEPDKGMPPIYDRIKQLTEEWKFPICFNFPVGHTERNLPLLCGAEACLKVEENKVILQFI